MDYEFIMTVRVSGDATEQEVIDFMRYECGDSGQIDISNPFTNEDDERNCEVTRVDLYI